MIIWVMRDNEGAEISEETYERLATMAVWEAQFRAPIVGRADLSAQIAAQLYAWVGDAQRQVIRQRFEFSEVELESHMARALSDLADSVDSTSSEIELQQIKNDRIARLSDLLLVHLRKGRAERFEQEICGLIGLSDDVGSRLLHRFGVSGVAILCGPMDLPIRSSARCMFTCTAVR